MHTINSASFSSVSHRGKGRQWTIRIQLGKVCRALVRWIQVEVQFLVLPFEISSLGNQSVSILADATDNWRAD